MRHASTPLTPAQVYRYALDCFQPHLKFRDAKTVSSSMLWTVLVAAAGWMTSLSDACRRFRKVPDEQTVAAALCATLPTYDRLRRRVHAALTGHLPKALRRRPQTVAIDLTLLPFYGDTSTDPRQFYRSQAKRGTCSFYAYASAYLIHKGHRYTVGLIAVPRDQSTEAIVRELLAQVRKAGIALRFLILDRGFYSVDVIRYLQAGRHRFLMPVVCHGRKPDHPLGPSGSQVFRARKTSGWFEYTLTNARQQKATVKICVKCRNRRGQRGKHGREPWIYAYWGIQPVSFDWVKQVYRQRFGIETSYRQINQARIRTTTTDFVLRYLYVSVAFLLRNLWVWLHYRVLSRRHQGGRVLELRRLPFRRMLWWLEQVANRNYGINEEVMTERSLPARLAS